MNEGAEYKTQKIQFKTIELDNIFYACYFFQNHIFFQKHMFCQKHMLFQKHIFFQKHMFFQKHIFSLQKHMFFQSVFILSVFLRNVPDLRVF